MLLFVLACVQPTDPDIPRVWLAPDVQGSWPVGVRTEEAPDPRGGTLTVELWYPSAGDGETVDYGLPYDLTTRAVRDGTAAGGPHPVVAFSHGHGGARQQSVFLMERLASHGFVVLAVDHPKDTIFDYDASATPTVAARRPDDLRYALDHLLAPDHPLASHIDDARVAVAGHSFGAWTALVLGGGALDLDAGRAYCASHDPAGCSIVGDVALDGPPPPPDPRISATVLLAPGGWYAFSDLAAVGPVLQVSGTRDGDLPYDEEQLPTFERLGPDRTLLALQDGGHFGFTDGCVLLPIADCAGAADGYMEPLRMQALTATAVTAWLGTHLLEDPRYTPWLDPTVWDDDARWISP